MTREVSTTSQQLREKDLPRAASKLAALAGRLNRLPRGDFPADRQARMSLASQVEDAQSEVQSLAERLARLASQLRG